MGKGTIVDWRTKPSSASVGFDSDLLTNETGDFLNVAGCGTRPICAFTQACKTKVATWQACVATNAPIKAEGKWGGGVFTQPSPQPQPSPSGNGGAQPTGMGMGAKIGIGLGIVAVLGATAYFLLRKKTA